MKEFIVRAYFTIEAESPAEARDQVIAFLEETGHHMEETMPGMVCSAVDNIDEVSE